MEFLKNIYTKYISVNLKDYIHPDLDFPINKVLIFVAIGLCIACIVINYTQSVTSRFLKKLIRLDAFSEDSSKTLKDLGLADHKQTQLIISRNSGAVKRILGVVGRKKITYEEYVAAENRKKELKKANKKARLTRSETSEEEKSSDQGSGLDAEIDFETARFYVISDEKAYAERYIRRDTSPLKTGLYCALIVLFFAVIIIAMPTLLTSIRGMV